MYLRLLFYSRKIDYNTVSDYPSYNILTYFLAPSVHSYNYTLEVDGKTLKKFVENRRKACRTWLPRVNEHIHRVVLGDYALKVHGGRNYVFKNTWCSGQWDNKQYNLEQNVARGVKFIMKSTTFLQ